MENNTFELEQMKELIALLNKKLEKESIINEKIIRKAVRSKVKSINNVAWIDFSLAFSAILMFYVEVLMSDISWIFFAVTCAVLVASVALSFITNRVKERDLIHGNLLEIGREVAKMKEQKRKVFLYFGIPVISLWLTYAVYEIGYKNSPNPDFWPYSAAFLLFGGFIGFLIGLKIYRRQQRNASDVLEQIEELMQE